jgi:hypothetical protein
MQKLASSSGLFLSNEPDTVLGLEFIMTRTQ